MKIELYTKSGKKLIEEIFSAVEDEVLKTWAIRESKEKKKFLTHKPEQWYDKVIIGFTFTDEKVTINLHYWENMGEADEATKGYYIGRFTEALLVHFKNKFTKFEIIK